MGRRDDTRGLDGSAVDHLAAPMRDHAPVAAPMRDHAPVAAPMRDHAPVRAPMRDYLLVLASLALAGLAALLSGCGNGNPTPCADAVCDPVPVRDTGCHKDADCGDGLCQADGTCRDRYTPGNVATACASVTCPTGQFCANGLCLPESPRCQPADPACIYVPHGSFEPPVHSWWWPWLTPAGPDDRTGRAGVRPDLEYPDYAQVMSTPVVMRLHAQDESPAVVFNSFWKNGSKFVESQGVLRAVSGVDGAPIWTAPKNFNSNTDISVDGNSTVAAGDCMGTGEVCFITGGFDPADVTVPTSLSHRHGGLIAFGSDGRLLWYNKDIQVWWGAPAIARLLSATGPAQVVVGNGVVDGATGKTLCPQTTSPNDQVGGNGDGTLTAIADIDLDGQPEIITGNQAYKLTANATSPTGYVCRTMFGQGVHTSNGAPCPGGAGKFCGDGFPAVANFAGYGAAMGLSPDDKHPEIVVVSHGTLRIHDWTGGMVLSPIPLPADPSCGAETNQGGAPTVADFDGDGLPEVGIAGQGGYMVWKPGRGIVWRTPTRDCSSNTGSSVFDFEGKGEAKVVYGDQCYVRIFDGKTGTALIAEKNASCTAYEMPVVADIDGTGRAKIVIPVNDVCGYLCDWGSQAGSGLFGLKALASATDKWVNTRSVWNQHTYHVTNVNIDGTLPFPEVNSWAPGQSNSYRQNVQGQGVFSAPDLSACEVSADMTDCRSGAAKVAVTVYNGGALVAKAGVTVAVYADLPDGTSALIGTSVTHGALQPGMSEKVIVPWPAAPQQEAVKLRAVVDEQFMIGDCHPENNVATSAPVKCSPLG